MSLAQKTSKYTKCQQCQQQRCHVDPLQKSECQARGSPIWQQRSCGVRSRQRPTRGPLSRVAAPRTRRAPGSSSAHEGTPAPASFPSLPGSRRRTPDEEGGEACSAVRPPSPGPPRPPFFLPPPRECAVSESLFGEGGGGEREGEAIWRWTLSLSLQHGFVMRS